MKAPQVEVTKLPIGKSETLGTRFGKDFFAGFASLLEKEINNREEISKTL